jgi:phage terminase large subunit GpA-like protein
MVSTITSARERKQKSDRSDEEFLQSLTAALRPPSHLSLSQWADKYRVLSRESSAEHGAWVTANAPYEREIMDAISDPFTERVCVQKAAQLGITDAAILNAIGYYIDQDPCPILVVQPTIEIAEAFSNDRLHPMLRDTPRLHGKVADARSRDSQNTLRRKSFDGGFVAIGGANSPATLSGRPVRVVLLDDVDRYPLTAGKEGSPLQLAIARTTAFWNRKIVIVSSPGTEGVSHIEREMATSTCEHWYLPCPQCGTHQQLMFERIEFDDLTHSCVACPAKSQKYQWLAGTGEFRAHRPFDERGNKVLVRGFFLSGLYNPWQEWDTLRDEFVRASRANAEGDVELLKAFNNTRLGRLHKEAGQKVDIDLFKLRREVYAVKQPEDEKQLPVEELAIAEVPDGVLVLTSGVDVGEREVWYEIVGWGRGRESWGIEYGILDGDPREPDVWELLDDAVYNRVLITHDNKKMKIKRIAVDSNYASDFVYAYTKPRQPRCVSVRGEGGLGKPLVKGAGTLTKGNRARLFTLGVDTGKEEITNRLRVSVRGAGFCHFPCSAHKSKEPDGSMVNDPARGYDEEYFKGLTAESRIAKHKHGFKTYLWTKRLSQRNEPFDVRNYALAALVLPFSGIKLETMKRDLLSSEDQKRSAMFGAQQARIDGVTTSTTAPPAAPQAVRFGAQNRPIY